MARLRAFTLAMLAAAVPPAAEEGVVSGSSMTRLSGNRSDAGVERFFETWNDLAWRRGPYSAALLYEAHLPPHPGSRDTVGQGIMERTFRYSEDGTDLKVGHFHVTLGNGLTLKTSGDRDMGLNTNLDGIYADFAKGLWEAKALAAAPRDPAGKRYAALQAGEIRVGPFHGAFLGSTWAATRTDASEIDHWGSAYAGYAHALGGLQFEAASRGFASGFLEDREAGSASPSGQAYFASGNLALGRWAAFAEGKHYRKFKLQEGAIYNDPPIASKEHAFALMNNRQPVPNADDESGVHAGLDIPAWTDAVLSLEWSRLRSVERGFPIYEEFFGQLDAPAGSRVHALLAAGSQADPESRNYNLVVKPDLRLGESYAASFEAQHQHTTIRLSRRMYWSGRYGLSLERNPGMTLSAIAEATSDQSETSDAVRAGVKYWGGLQADLAPAERLHLTLFAGTRRKGKICAGGICVQRPPLSGIEGSVRYRF